jgi:outer membrane protein with beta-barrel domain
MSHARTVLGALVIAAASGAPLAAQNHAVTLFARGGGYNGLTNLNDAGTADFKKTGYNLGGGAAVQLQKYLSLRGDFTYGRNELRTNSTPTGVKANRYLYDAAVQVQYPTAGGFEPYAFGGGGAVTVHQVGTSGQNKTKGAGTFGLGLNYRIPGTQFGVFAEGKSWLYKLDSMSGALAGFNKTQLDVAWSGGLSYRFPL